MIDWWNSLSTHTHYAIYFGIGAAVVIEIVARIVTARIGSRGDSRDR